MVKSMLDILKLWFFSISAVIFKILVCRINQRAAKGSYSVF